MRWIRKIYDPYLRRLSPANPPPFEEVWARSRARLLVQVPWAGSIRFKGLIRLEATEMDGFAEDPVGWISARFGGGKYKVNFYDGDSFVGTHNFEAAGDPKWQDLPEVD